MSNKEEILREKTFKEEGMEIERRVFYTLTDKENLQAYRNSKFAALLVKALVDKGVLAEEDVDDMLFECVW